MGQTFIPTRTCRPLTDTSLTGSVDSDLGPVLDQVSYAYVTYSKGAFTNDLTVPSRTSQYRMLGIHTITVEVPTARLCVPLNQECIR